MIARQLPATSLALLALAFAALTLASCTGNGTRAEIDTSPGGAGLFVGGMPPLPQEVTDEALGRDASVAFNIMLEGVDYLDTNTLAVGVGSLYLIPNEPGVGPLAWAMYKFDGLGADFTATAFDAGLFDMVIDSEYYVAFADYSTDSWEITAFTAESSTTELSLLPMFDPLRHISPAHNIYLVVMTYNLDLAVEFIDLSGSYSLGAPQNISATDLASPDIITVTGETVPGAEGYEIFYKEAGQPDEFYGFLDAFEENDGQVWFEHTGTYPPGKPAVFGVEYEYKVRAVADGEDPSPFSNTDTGSRGYPAPYRLIASDQAYADKVFLIWFSDTSDHTDEHTYVILRDGDPFDQVTVNGSGGGQFSDVFALDGAEREYQVYETGPEGSGEPSPTDTGCVSSYWHNTLAGGGIGDSFFADMEVSPADPALPTVAAYVEDSNQIIHGHSGGSSFTKVTDAACDETMDLTIHDGRPWILFGNKNAAFGPEGLRIARGKVADPDAEEFWDVYTVLECDVSAENVSMAVVNGRLGMLFSRRTGDQEHTLHYAYALDDDPQLNTDWNISKIDMYHTTERPNYMKLAERNSAPLVAVQFDDPEIQLFEATTAEPGGLGDWSVYDVPIGTPVAGPSGIDLLVYDDGMVYVPFLEGNFESSGRAFLMYSRVWPPTEQSHWWPSHLTDFEDEAVRGISIMFYNKRPWISWSHSGEKGPMVASHLYDEDYNQGGWHGGLWHIDSLPLRPIYYESRYETKLLAIDGMPSLLYVAAYNDPENSGYDLRFCRMNDKPE